MILTLKSIHSAQSLGVDAIGTGLALFAAGGVARLLYTEAQVNAAQSLSLGAAGQAASGFVSPQSLAAPLTLGNLEPGHGIAFAASGTGVRAYLFDAHAGAMRHTLLGSTGAPGAAQVVRTDQGPLARVETFAMLGGAAGDHAALSQWDTEGLRLFAVNANGSLTLSDTMQDTDKSYLGNVSDTASVRLGGVDYLLSLSSLENGITSFAVDGRGRAELVDSLGNHDMLAVTGPAALQVMKVAGTAYAVIASTGSSSLTVVRVNDRGCLFQTDHVVDDRTTRFDHTAVLDSFKADGRSFIVTGGTDAGLTVMELRPDGHLQPFATGVFETGAGMGNITGLEAAVNGDVVSLFVVDAGAERIQRIEMDISDLGGMITATGGVTAGTGLDDLLWGSTGRDTLQGGGGDDILHGNGGVGDRLTGGAGADVFVFNADTDNATITDFALHVDRIDLSEWGRVYTADALTITSTATGAIIALNGHQVTVEAGQRLQASAFQDSDFIF